MDKFNFRKVRRYRKASKLRCIEHKPWLFLKKKPLPEFICEFCGGKYKRSKKQMYCSMKCMGLARRGKNMGEKCYSWKGGSTSVALKVRHSVKMKEWRQSVFLWDDFTCQDCGKRGGSLRAHHIKPFSELLQETRLLLPLIDFYTACLLYTPLWDLNNGRTLCRRCHKKYHKRHHWKTGGE